MNVPDTSETERAASRKPGRPVRTGQRRSDAFKDAYEEEGGDTTEEGSSQLDESPRQRKIIIVANNNSRIQYNMATN